MLLYFATFDFVEFDAATIHSHNFYEIFQKLYISN